MQIIGIIFKLPHVPAPYQILTWPCIVFNLIFCHFPLAHNFPATLASSLSKQDKLFCFRVIDWNVLSFTFPGKFLLIVQVSFSLYGYFLREAIFDSYPLNCLPNVLFDFANTYHNLYLYTYLFTVIFYHQNFHKRTMCFIHQYMSNT